MSFSRHNIDKRGLIDLVRLNPILWDCRLPHYKRSDKKKAIKWNELGRTFNVSGERVQRTFTSLREIFRRELNHEKMLGNGFSSKWEYYDAMSFLKGVIRERKSRERLKKLHSNGLNGDTGQAIIDEYQYFAPNDPNNPNNLNQTQLQQQISQQEPTFNEDTTKQVDLTTNTAVLPQQNEPKINNNMKAITNISMPNTKEMFLNQQQQLDSAQQSVETLNNNDFAAEVNLCSSSSSPSIYIKSEIDEDSETNDILFGDNVDQLTDMMYLSETPENMSNIVQLPIAAAPHFQCRKFYDLNKRQTQQNRGAFVQEPLRYNQAVQQQATSQSSPLGQNRVFTANMDIEEPDSEERTSNAGGNLAIESCVSLPLTRQPTSARQELYTNFGVFLATRLNTLNESVADELMNRILMLVAEN